MAVSTSTRKQQFTLDGVTAAFTFTFRALTSAPSDIKCVVTSGTTDTDLTYTTDFTVSVNANGVGGTVTIVVPASWSGTLTVYRDTTNTQESDYDDYNQFPANTLENDLDIRTLLSQEQDEAIDRIVQFPISYSGTASTILPTPVADTVLGWNAAGNELENKTIVPSSSFQLATQSEAEAGVNNVSYMSALRVAQQLAANKATGAEAVAGSNDAHFMTPSTTSLAIAALATSGPPLHYRSGLACAQSSTTVLAILQGVVEINSQAVTKTGTTSNLSIATAGHWAGGVSLRATSTAGYIGVDASGNVKLHTTAPTHSNYAVSDTNGTLRYATWSGTVYRVIGWFYMNSTGSGELNAWEVSNISDSETAPNKVSRNGNSTDVINDTSYGTDLTECLMRFYSSGGKVRIHGNFKITVNGNGDLYILTDIDGTDQTTTERGCIVDATNTVNGIDVTHDVVLSQGLHTIDFQAKANSTSNRNVVNKEIYIEEK